MTQADNPVIIRHVDSGATCCDPDWESAYRRFETADEEVRKFSSRLRSLGVDKLPKDARIVELFCGRGGGLVALQQLGFQDLAGVDLSDTLLSQYRGPAELHLADCRSLPFDDESIDAVIIQGGLHHLPTLPDDLDSVLGEVRRVLRSAGTLYVVEPWLTPFLSFVHTVVAMRAVRKIWGRADALAEMIDRERETYERWLGMPRELLEVFDKHFPSANHSTRWGKLCLLGIKSITSR